MGREASYWDRSPEEEQKIEITEEYLESIRHSGKEIEGGVLKAVAKYLLENPKPVHIGGMWYAVAKKGKTHSLFSWSETGELKKVIRLSTSKPDGSPKLLTQYLVVFFYFGYLSNNELWSLKCNGDDIPIDKSISNTVLRLRERLIPQSIDIKKRRKANFSNRYSDNLEEHTEGGYYIGDVSKHRSNGYVHKFGPVNLNSFTGAFSYNGRQASFLLNGSAFEIMKLIISKGGKIKLKSITEYFAHDSNAANVFVFNLKKALYEEFGEEVLVSLGSRVDSELAIGLVKS